MMPSIKELETIQVVKKLQRYIENAYIAEGKKKDFILKRAMIIAEQFEKNL